MVFILFGSLYSAPPVRFGSFSLLYMFLSKAFQQAVRCLNTDTLLPYYRSALLFYMHYTRQMFHIPVSPSTYCSSSVPPGGTRVRASGGIPLGSPAVRRSQGSRPLLHHALHRHVQEGRPQDGLLRRAPSGGEKN